jgi:hypothetical protein
MASTDYPRALTEQERAALDFMLSVDDPRVEPLRGQAATAAVVGTCECGCPTITLSVDRTGTEPAALWSPAIETVLKDAVVIGPGEVDRYMLLLFLEHGWLASLELVSFRPKGNPVTFPPPTAFNPPRVTG